MKLMKCPLNSNVKDSFGCIECYDKFHRESTRAECVINSKAKYIEEESNEIKIKEIDPEKPK